MRSTRLQTAALLLALVLGQWLTVAHAFLHPVTAGPDTHCEFCLHGPGLDSGTVATPAKLVVVPVSTDIVELPVLFVVTSFAPGAHSIRGPPSLAG